MTVAKRLPLAMIFVLMMMQLGGCFEKTIENAIDTAKNRAAEIIADALKQKDGIIAKARETAANMTLAQAAKMMEAEAPGSSAFTDTTDDEGVTTRNYETSVSEDVVSIINGGGGIKSILFYIFSLALSFLSAWLKGVQMNKRIGTKDMAMDVITGRINKMAGDSKFGAAFKWLTGSVETAASRTTPVGAEIHASAKRTEKHRDTVVSIANPRVSNAIAT